MTAAAAHGRRWRAPAGALRRRAASARSGCRGAAARCWRPLRATVIAPASPPMCQHAPPPALRETKEVWVKGGSGRRGGECATACSPHLDARPPACQPLGHLGTRATQNHRRLKAAPAVLQPVQQAVHHLVLQAVQHTRMGWAVDAGRPWRRKMAAAAPASPPVGRAPGGSWQLDRGVASSMACSGRWVARKTPIGVSGNSPTSCPPAANQWHSPIEQIQLSARPSACLLEQGRGGGAEPSASLPQQHGCSPASQWQEMTEANRPGGRGLHAVAAAWGTTAPPPLWVGLWIRPITFALWGTAQSCPEAAVPAALRAAPAAAQPPVPPPPRHERSVHFRQPPPAPC